MVNYFQYEHTFKLESGEELQGLQIAYSIYGKSNAKQTIWVCHALSGNSEVNSWWQGLFGDGGVFASGDFKVICANVLGYCYGTTGPSNLNSPLEFPLITI